MSAPVSQITHVDLLRHGECEGGHIFRGYNDVALTPEGLARMQATIAGCSPWHRVVSSPLRRCRVFSETLAAADLAFDDRLREMSFGTWEGRLVDEVWQTESEAITAWSRDPTSFTPPGGESLQNLAARVMECFKEAVARHRGERLLLVTHGGVIRVLLSQLLDMPLSSAGRIHVPYAALSTVAVYHHDSGDQIRLLGHNWLGEAIDHV